MTQLLHLALKCITFTVGQFITFSVKVYYIYGGCSRSPVTRTLKGNGKQFELAGVRVIGGR